MYRRGSGSGRGSGRGHRSFMNLSIKASPPHDPFFRYYFTRKRERSCSLVTARKRRNVESEARDQRQAFIEQSRICVCVCVGKRNNDKNRQDDGSLPCTIFSFRSGPTSSLLESRTRIMIFVRSGRTRNRESMLATW